MLMFTGRIDNQLSIPQSTLNNMKKWMSTLTRRQHHWRWHLWRPVTPVTTRHTC